MLRCGKNAGAILFLYGIPVGGMEKQKAGGFAVAGEWKAWYDVRHQIKRREGRMRELWEDIRWFLNQKIYVVAVILTAVCSYGFGVVSPGLGIDDVATELYFTDGLAVVMGRWVIFLLNKIFHMAKYTPFVTDFMGVFLLVVAALLMSVLFHRILWKKISIVGYVAFSCVFLANPMISEVYLYYLHNGIGIGYVVTALALLLFEKMQKVADRKKWVYIVGSVILLTVAVGCYESFMILYLLGVTVILFLRAMEGREILTFGKIMKQAGWLLIVAAGTVLLRKFMIISLTAVFDLQDLRGLMNERKLSEMLVLFRGSEGWNEFLMLVKRFWLVYHVNAFVYLPITGYELAVVLFGIVSVVLAIRKKSLCYPILAAAMVAIPFLLTVVEANVTLYRSTQYLPFFTAAGVLLMYSVVSGMKKKKYIQPIVTALLVILVFRYAQQMNRNFYGDYLSYENTKEVLTQVAVQIEREYGSDIPVVFTGHYEIPHSLLEDWYVDYSSKQFQRIAAVTDLVDIHLKEKYYSPYGYSFIGNAQYSYIQWAFDAFDGTNREMIRFLELHGHSFQTITDKDILEEARSVGENMPSWPQKGSVQMQDGYLLIHI